MKVMYNKLLCILTYNEYDGFTSPQKNQTTTDR